MNLFEWSEPFYKTNCSRFLQLVFRMLRDFNQPIELETVYEFTARSKVARFLADQTERAKVKIEVPKREKFVLDQEPLPEEQPEPELPELIEEEITEPVGEESIKEAELPEEPEPNPESELTNEDLAKLLGDIPTAEPEDSAAALFGLQDEIEPIDPSIAVEAEPMRPSKESEPLVKEDVQDLPAADSPEEPPTSADPEEEEEPVRASTLFEGLEGEEEPSEPEVRYQVEWDEEMRAKIEYYRERFFGLEEEDDDDEPSGISFGALTSLRNQLAELIESDLGHLFVEREDGIDLKTITDNNEVAIFSISGNNIVLSR
ncbi:hypothetical protein BSK63_16905 [Paenibacillus odorifer]|nr:hypothetical protein BSK63_16905 [Paenibacillus odorifer]